MTSQPWPSRPRPHKLPLPSTELSTGLEVMRLYIASITYVDVWGQVSAKCCAKFFEGSPCSPRRRARRSGTPTLCPNTPGTPRRGGPRPRRDAAPHRYPPATDWKPGLTCLTGQHRRKHFECAFVRISTPFITRQLTQCDGALGLRTGTLVLWEIKAQSLIPDGLGDVVKILHEVSAQRAVQEGVPKWGRGAVEIPCHGRMTTSLTRLRREDRSET